jgi:hypothetical protein
LTASLGSRIVSSEAVSMKNKPPKITVQNESTKQLEVIERPRCLDGSTYKLKSPLTEHAHYITINNIKINEKIYPFEIFINSKQMSAQEYVVALTRVISSVFRNSLHFKDGAAFLVEELQAVFSPGGGYLKKGRKVPSIIAEFGDVLEEHLQKIGCMPKPDELPEYIQEKRKEALKNPDLIANARQCAKCLKVAVVRLDNCDTCLKCGDAKCG